MKKKLAVSFLSMAVALSVNAVPALHKLFPMKQTDGTTVMLYKNGNGGLAFYTTPDNHVVLPNANGTLCYAQEKDGVISVTDILVHDIEARTPEEKTFIMSSALKPSDEAVVRFVATNQTVTHNGPQKALYVSTEDGLGKYGTSGMGSVPSIGSPIVPVIMVEFADKKFQESMTVEKFSRFMNEEGYSEDNNYERGSVKDYFKSQSRGLFNPTFDVVGKVTMSNGYAYYGENNTPGEHGTGDKHARIIAMLKEAVSGAISQGADFNKYTVNGRIPNVIIYYAGCGEATGGDPNTIWPHEYDLPIYSGSISGFNFNSYFVGNELNGTEPNTRVMGMGVMVHELCHALGLPDFYVTDYNYSGNCAMGGWSVLDNGEYDSDAYAPVGFNAYERSCLGWLDIKELKDGEAVNLAPEDIQNGDNSVTGETNTDLAVMFRNPNNYKEYFILENRQPGTWHQSSNGSGLLVTRVAYDLNTWRSNAVNNIQSYQRVKVITASGRKMSGNDATSSDLYGNGVNSIPEFMFIDGTKYTEAPIYKIIKQPNGVITFSFKDKTADSNYSVSNAEVFDKVTDVSTLTANDKVIFVNEADKVAMASFMNNGNRNVVSVKIENGQVYGNESVMKFSLLKAASGAGWGFRSVDNNQYMGASTAGIKSTAKGDASCMATINITDGNASVVFGGTQARKNLSYNSDNVCFSCYNAPQENIQIYRLSSSTGIKNVELAQSEKANGRMFNLAGQQVDKGYKGIVIVNGKKILKK